MEGVRKDHRHRGGIVRVLDCVDLEIDRGEYVSIVGRSGSGKSTLLLMLGGMLSPTEGRVVIDGISLYDMRTASRADLRKEQLGFLFQTFNLIPYLTALENVQVPLLLRGVDGPDQASTAADLLDRVGLQDRVDHKPPELSVGQQQRVALARMLANDPAVILADEPTGNLDPETSAQILEFLEEMNGQGKTVVMVTHDPEAANRASRKLRLCDGAVVPG
jgi:putative ABC transport system ATP-binding protein